MNKIFNLVGPTLDRVTDALEAIDIDDTSDIPAIIREKTNAYTELVTATEYLETGLSYWDLPMSQDEEEVDIEAYIQESGERLKTQKEAIDLIRGDLRSRGAREPFGKPALETYEFNLRKEVLATLLPIPQPKMLEDQALRNRITDSERHGYISNKGDIIRSLRNAKITLNLALDMHELIKPPLRLTRQHLGDHLTDCITYLGAALKDW